MVMTDKSGFVWFIRVAEKGRRTSLLQIYNAYVAILNKNSNNFFLT